jgi:predicted ATPase
LLEGTPLGDESLPPTQAPELRFRLVEAIVSLLEQLSLSRPVVLALEDLHWADPSSLLVLDRLGRRGDLLALVATRRPLPRPRALELVVSAAAERNLHVVLPPLDEAQLAELATMLLGAPPGEELLATLGRAGGIRSSSRSSSMPSDAKGRSRLPTGSRRSPTCRFLPRFG